MFNKLKNKLIWQNDVKNDLKYKIYPKNTE